MNIIQISNTYRGEVLDLVKKMVPEGFEIRTLSENTSEELSKKIEDADYLLASGRVPVTDAVLTRAPKLKMIQRTGVGLDSLDLIAIQNRNIPLYVNKGVNAESVAEHALLLTLACLRRLIQINNDVKIGIWSKQQQGIHTRELSQKTVGIIGMGNIGRRFAGLLKGFDVNVVYADQYLLSPEAEKGLDVKHMELEELFACADVVSLHCPLTKDNKNIICKKTLNAMKDGVIIINTARGGLICEQDLIEAIQDGKVYAAGLDVYKQEPVSLDNELLKMSNVITTPHIGGVTYDSFSEMIRSAMHNIQMFHEGHLDEIASSRYC